MLILSIRKVQIIHNYNIKIEETFKKFHLYKWMKQIMYTTVIIM